MRFTPFLYLASYTLSLLGNSIAGVALPLIVLQVTGSALGAGAVAAATAIPAVLSGLLQGVAIVLWTALTTLVSVGVLAVVAPA